MVHGKIIFVLLPLWFSIICAEKNEDSTTIEKIEQELKENTRVMDNMIPESVSLENALEEPHSRQKRFFLLGTRMMRRNNERMRLRNERLRLHNERRLQTLTKRNEANKILLEQWNRNINLNRQKWAEMSFQRFPMNFQHFQQTQQKQTPFPQINFQQHQLPDKNPTPISSAVPAPIPIGK